MRILWITNMVLPQVSSDLGFETSVSGGWLVDFSKRLSEDENVVLATMTYARIPALINQKVAGIQNYIFPGGGKRLLFTSKKTLKDLKFVIDDFKPDLIHIYGTEYSIAYSITQMKLHIPILLTIQGILTRISEEYYAGLTIKELLKTITFKRLIKGKTIFTEKMLFLKNAKRERKIIRNIRYVTGRTIWDESIMKEINKQLQYFRLDFNLREEFYNKPLWKVNKSEPYTIFCGASPYALKGLHMLIKALAIVKDQYPLIKLKIPGYTINKRAKTTNGYIKYILKLINNLKLNENIEFVGKISANDVVKHLSSARIAIVPSSIESDSITLCEAMMIGTPCICSFRGGMTSLLKDGESGFYYDFKEYPVLADRIIKLLENDELCEKFSINAHKDACIRHDRDKNYTELISIYEKIIRMEEK